MSLLSFFIYCERKLSKGLKIIVLWATLRERRPTSTLSREITKEVLSSRESSSFYEDHFLGFLSIIYRVPYIFNPFLLYSSLTLSQYIAHVEDHPSLRFSAVIHLLKRPNAPWETSFRSETVKICDDRFIPLSVDVISPFFLPPTGIDDHSQTRTDGLLFTKSNSCRLSPCSHGILFPKNTFVPLSLFFPLSFMYRSSRPFVHTHALPGVAYAWLKKSALWQKKRLALIVTEKSVLRANLDGRGNEK